MVKDREKPLKDMNVIEKSERDTLVIEAIYNEVLALRSDIKALKMNMLQINHLKVRMGERV